MDFQEERRLDAVGFCRSVFSHIEEGLPERPAVAANPDFGGLQQVVEELNREGFRIIITLDEFDRVTRSSTFDADFFAGLRSLAGHNSLAYITSSSRDLQELCHTQEIADSPFFNIFSTVQLGSLQPEEARALIVEPSASTPYPLEEHGEMILDLGGRPAELSGTTARTGVRTAVHEEHDDAGEHVVVDGVHRELDTELALVWRGRGAPLECTGFAFDLQVTRTPA